MRAVVWVLAATSLLQLAACRGQDPGRGAQGDTPNSAQGAAAPHPAFAPLDAARIAHLTAQSDQFIALVWGGRCDQWRDLARAPFGYGRRDLHFRDRVGVSLLSEGQTHIYCQDLAAVAKSLNQPPPALALESSAHIPAGQWEVRDLKALAPNGTDRLTFAIHDKPGEALELYFDAEGHVVALINVERPSTQSPPSPPSPPLDGVGAPPSAPPR
jgi:hypothetical protein